MVLHLAAANYCWLTDPSRALCLKLAGTPPPASRWPECATRPAAPGHATPCRPVWANPVTSTTAFIGSLGRTRTAGRARLPAELDRAQRVLDSINAATAKDDANADYR